MPSFERAQANSGLVNLRELPDWAVDELRKLADVKIAEVADAAKFVLWSNQPFAQLLSFEEWLARPKQENTYRD